MSTHTTRTREQWLNARQRLQSINERTRETRSRIRFRVFRGAQIQPQRQQIPGIEPEVRGSQFPETGHDQAGRGE